MIDRAARGARLGAMVAVCLAIAALPACHPRVASLPSGVGSPFPDAISAYAEATSACRSVRTLSAELAMSGNARGQRLRGRILAGFADPGMIRLEAPAPFGRPVFTLVAHGETATLVLNRDRRVLRDAPSSALLDVLAGVALGPDDLRRAVAGCGLDTGQVTAGRRLPSDWAVVDGESGSSWLRLVGGAWRLAGSRRGPLEVRYDDFAAGRAATIRFRTSAAAGDPATDMALRLSQVEIGAALAADVFEIDVPADATPLSLDELRHAGPGGGGREPLALHPDAAATRS